MSVHAFTVAVFAVLGSALLGLELVARLPRSPVPTLSRLLRNVAHFSLPSIDDPNSILLHGAVRL